MFLLTDYLNLIPNETGRLVVLDTLTALSDRTGWPLLRVLQFVIKNTQAYQPTLKGTSTGKALRARNARFTESAPTTGNYTFPMRAAGGLLTVDVNDVNGPDGAILRAQILTAKVMDIGARLNRTWFKGDGVSQADEFTGVNRLCVDLNRIIFAGSNGAPLSADMLDELLAMVPGATHILCNTTLANQASKLETRVTRTLIVNQGNATPNMFEKSYGGVPIVEVLDAPDDATGVRADILPFDETKGQSGAVCSRITAVRLGLNGVYGIHRAMLTVDAPRREGALEHNDMNWFMAGVATDRSDAVAQLAAIKKS